MKKQRTEKEQEERAIRRIILVSIALFILMITSLLLLSKPKKDDLPTAEALLSSIWIPQIPGQLSTELITQFLNRETSITVDAKMGFHYVAQVGQDTRDITYRFPFTGTLDICTLEDGRNLLSIGGTMDMELSGPYMDKMQEHYEKSYFAIVNPDLQDVDIYMRERSPYTEDESGTVSVNTADAGNWQFINDRSIDLQAFIDEYNKDHEGSAITGEDMNTAMAQLRTLLAKDAKVTYGSYRGTNTYVLSTRLDFKDAETKAMAQEMFRYLEVISSDFYHWNLSQFLDYYGEFTVINLKMFFTPSENNTYNLLACSFDLSEIRFIDYMAKRIGKDPAEFQKIAKFEPEEFRIDLIFLPGVPDTIKAYMNEIVKYTDERLVNIQYGIEEPEGE